ncbi:MAG: glycosyltransferase family 39 protein [Planctomycetota bacterium]|jgi:4-amino-4-deoxy-L-arabinose transferase-like glycosyltransferase
MTRHKPAKSKKKPGKLEIVSNSAKLNRKKRFLIALAAFLAAIPFVMGKYIEFNSPGAFDSGAYVYSAAHIINGAEIGLEETPSAQLGTLLVNMLGVWLFGFNDIGPKIIQMFMQAGALILLFIAMKKIFGCLSAAVGLIVASVFLSSPLFAKFGNVKEQYMIACMVIGISSFILFQCDGKWWWALIAGAFLSWAPLFKQTGVSAIGAVGIFVVLQPFFKNRTFKQTGIDIALLIAGAAVALAPLYIWIIGWDIGLPVPYKFAFRIMKKWFRIVGLTAPAAATSDAVKETAQTTTQASGYLARGRQMVPFSVQAPRVLRHYKLAILPISLAIASIFAGVLRIFLKKLKPGHFEKRNYDRFVLLLGVWWILDMAFVWISARSYEQYYLPLNASAAMLAGYIVALYAEKLKTASSPNKWIATGVLASLVMIVMSLHVFFGISSSPFSGMKYGQKRRGYVQRLSESYQRRKNNTFGYWEAVGSYIRQNSTPDDKMYVWGWFPGIYVKAQRFAPTSRSSMMPRPSPRDFRSKIDRLLEGFKKEPPKFIVDSKKNHIPMNRLPYELWPVIPKIYTNSNKSTFLPLNKKVVTDFDNMYMKALRQRHDEDEALRYEYLGPLREFIRKNYRIVQPKLFKQTNRWPWLYHQWFGTHVLFELKNPAANKETQ